MIATHRNLLVMVWHGQPAEAMLKRLEALVRGPLEQQDSVLTLTVIEQSAAPPSADIRKAIARLMDSKANRIRASALVFEGNGFRASTVRSVATGLSLLARRPYPHRTFATVKEAAMWLSLEDHCALEPDDIAAVVQRTRKVVESHSLVQREGVT